MKTKTWQRFPELYLPQWMSTLCTSVKELQLMDKTHKNSLLVDLQKNHVTLIPLADLKLIEQVALDKNTRLCVCKAWNSYYGRKPWFIFFLAVKLKNILNLFLTNTQLLSSPNVKAVIIVMFLSDSHSDGTHSLQWIYFWWSIPLRFSHIFLIYWQVKMVGKRHKASLDNLIEFAFHSEACIWEVIQAIKVMK